MSYSYSTISLRNLYTRIFLILSISVFAETGNTILERLKRNEILNISNENILNSALKKPSIFDDFTLAEIHRYKGDYYNERCKTDSALYHYQKSLKLFGAKNVKKRIATTLDIANLYYQAGFYTESENIIINCLKSLSTIPKERVLYYRAYQMLGILMTENKNFPEAIKFYGQSIKALENYSYLPHLYYHEIALNNIGYSYQQMGEHNKAIILFLKALERNKLESDPALKAMLLDNLGYSQFLLRPHSFTPDLLYQGLEIRQNGKIIPGIILSNLHLSEFFIYKRDLSTALFHAKKAIFYSQKYKLPIEEQLALKLILKIDPRMMYVDNLNKLTDSLQLAERRARNKFARIAFETDEITQEKDQAIQDKWLVISVASLALMLTLTLAIIIRQRARQKELLFAQEQQAANHSIYQLMHDQQAKINEGRQIEKKRIARELHDGVMNRLASTRLNLFVLNKRKDEDTVNKCLPFINEIQGIEKEIRQVAHDLDNELFSGNVTFNNILDDYFLARNNVSLAKIHHDITADINWNAIDSNLKINLYRIIQEAVNNVEKHADAKNLFITIVREEGKIKLLIHDDGKGFDATRAKSGIGLKNISTRARMSGGSVDIKSGHGRGTLLTVTMPITDVV